eukprot:m.81662 g.81662  ORF g.81662 m.81662 type:complete len:455 (+) comp12820_c0_seq1:223-1587(+)
MSWVNNSVATSEPLAEFLETGITVTSLPVVAMLLGVVFANYRQPSDSVRALFGAAGAGIFVAVVSLELMPALKTRPSVWYASSGGFALGVLSCAILGALFPSNNASEEEEDEQQGTEEIPLMMAQTSLDNALVLASNNRVAYNRMPSEVRIIDCSTKDEADWFERKFQGDPLYLGRVGLRLRMLKRLSGTNTELPPRYHFAVCGGKYCKRRGSQAKLNDIEDLVLNAPDVKLTLSSKCIGSTCTKGPNMSVVDYAASSSGQETFYDDINQTVVSRVLRELGIAGRLSRGVANKRRENSGFPWARLALLIGNVLVDGLVLGLASSLGLKEAALLALGMSLENFFTGVSMHATIFSRLPCFAGAAFALFSSCFIYVGFVIGCVAVYQADQRSAYFIGCIGFTSAVLLYSTLVILIPEVFELAQTFSKAGLPIWTTVMLFLGIDIVILLDAIIPSSV